MHLLSGNGKRDGLWINRGVWGREKGPLMQPDLVFVLLSLYINIGLPQRLGDCSQNPTAGL